MSSYLEGLDVLHGHQEQARLPHVMVLHKNALQERQERDIDRAATRTFFYVTLENFVVEMDNKKVTFMMVEVAVRVTRICSIQLAGQRAYASLYEQVWNVCICGGKRLGVPGLSTFAVTHGQTCKRCQFFCHWCWKSLVIYPLQERPNQILKQIRDRWTPT
jgi:hypothetical protein